MGIMVGSARIDENGNIKGGAVGDQKQTVKTGDTKGEVSQQPFYVHSKGWIVLRPKSSDLADKLAELMITACDNANIGYDQGNRNGVLRYGVNTKTKTECDCSGLVRALIYWATGKDPGAFSTSTEVDKLMSTGLFEKIVFTSLAKTPVYNGDILVTKTKGHTVIVTSGNPRKTNQYYPRYTGTSVSIIDALKAVGEKDTSKSHRKLIATENGMPNYTGTAAQNRTMLQLLKAGKLLKHN